MYAITVCVPKNPKEIDTDFVFSSIKFTMLMQWCEGEFLSVNKYLLI